VLARGVRRWGHACQTREEDSYAATDNLSDNVSKITFRADDELVAQLEEFDASKSEVMRRALRSYLGEEVDRSADPADSVDELIAERVDELVERRVDRAFTRRHPQDINVNIALEGDSTAASDAAEAAANVENAPSYDVPDESSHADEDRKTDPHSEVGAAQDERKTCTQCGEVLSPSHVYCPNCGEKASRRVFCECGDELRSDWGFCPGCGRRTPAADVLDQP